jgi:hypothetical protein
MNKKCGKCQQILSIECFSKNKSKYDGLQSRCKECVRVHQLKHWKQEQQRTKEWRLDNHQELLKNKKIYYQENRGKISEHQKDYRRKHQEIIKNRKKGYYLEHKDEVSKKSKVYREGNKEKLYLRDKRWREENREYRNEYRKNKYHRDVIYRLQKTLRTRLNQAIRGGYKSGSAIRDLGCPISELKQWLEQQFYPNPRTGEMMTWENHGLHGWHIDHIVPLYTFDLTDRKQFLKANHWFNLQPLWAEENYAKISQDLSLGNEALLLSSSLR